MALELPASLVDPTLGVAYSETIEATGGTPPYVYSILTGNPASGLPAGLTLDSDGTLHGTPTMSSAYPVQIMVVDDFTYSYDKWYTLRVSGRNVLLIHDRVPSYTAPGDPVSIQVVASRGTPSAARFNNPRGIVADADRNLFVCDADNHCIRKVEPSGAVSVFAGNIGTAGSMDGTGTGAEFNTPWGIAIDSSGDMYVTDNGNHTIRKVTSAGVVTTLAGAVGTPDHVDDVGNNARFENPTSITIDASGNLYVLDQTNTVIRKIDTGLDVTTDPNLGSPSPGPIYFNDALNRLYLIYDDGAYATPYLAAWDYDYLGLERPYMSDVSSFAMDSLNNIYVCHKSGTIITLINNETGGDRTICGDTNWIKEHGSFDGFHNNVRMDTINGMFAGPLGHVYFTENTHAVRELIHLNYRDQDDIVSSRLASTYVVTRAGVSGVSGTDNSTAQYTWSFGNETIPPVELSLSAGGLITGTCPADPSTVYIHAEDGDGNVGVTAVQFSIGTLHSKAPSALYAVGGQPYYNEPIEVDGGYEPYSWFLVGDLPTGYSLNEDTGFITGGSFEYGLHHFGVQVTDSNPTPELVQTIYIPMEFHIQDGPVIVGGPGVSPQLNPAYVGVPFSAPNFSYFAGGTLPYKTTANTENNNFPVPDWISFTADPVTNALSVTGTPDAKCFLPFSVAIADGNNFYANWGSTGRVGVSDPAEGEGGYGVPYIEYNCGEGALSFKETENAADVGLGGCSDIYGGYPPYTIENIGDLPPGMTYGINEGYPYLAGSTTQQGIYDLSFRITDSASTITPEGVPAFYVWADNGLNNDRFSATPDIRTVAFEEITFGEPLGFSPPDEHVIVAGNYAFVLKDGYTSGNEIHVFALDVPSYVGTEFLPNDRYFPGYTGLSFSDDGTIACIVSTDVTGENFWLETYSHSLGVLTHLESLSIPNSVFYTSPNRIGFSSTNTAYVGMTGGLIAVVPAPYDEIASTIDLSSDNGGTTVYSTHVVHSDTRLLAGSSNAGNPVVYVIELGSNAVSHFDVPEYLENYPPDMVTMWMSSDKSTLFLSDSTNYSPHLTLVTASAPFSSETMFTQIDTTGYDVVSWGTCLPDGSGIVMRTRPDVGQSRVNTIMNAPYNSDGSPGTFEYVLNSPSNGHVFTGRGPAPAPYSGPYTNNTVDYNFTLEVYKKLYISHVLLNVGEVGVPYKYKILDNYEPGDVSYPTAYQIESGGQGLLPTGYETYHDPITHENFIQGTTSFSNTFPITLGGYNDRYSGGVPRDTWDTNLYVGGYITVSHEVV